MNTPIQTNFIFNDGIIHDASVSEVSQSIRSCYKYEWSIAPITAGLTSAKGEYTVEVSNDNVNWFEYNNLSTDVSIEDAVDDIHLAWVYMRIVYDAKTESTGTVQFELTQKQQS